MSNISPDEVELPAARLRDLMRAIAGDMVDTLAAAAHRGRFGSNASEVEVDGENKLVDRWTKILALRAAYEILSHEYELTVGGCP